MSLRSSIIPFDSGKSYVVCDLPRKQEKYEPMDKLGRTNQDRRFLEQFERIFLAAAEGDLKTCQDVVGNGFFDLKAVSYGRFGTESGTYFNNISPIQIAEMKGHQEIVEYFKTIIYRNNSKNWEEFEIQEQSSSESESEFDDFPSREPENSRRR